MHSQRLAPFRRGRHLSLSRACCELRGAPRDVFWAERGLACLARTGYDSAALVVAPAEHAPPGPGLPERIVATSRGPRLMGMAAPPTADGLVLVHEHARGARIVTHAGGRALGERTYLEEHFDVHIATDGHGIVLSNGRGDTLRCFDSWTLETFRPWSLEPLYRVLGDVDTRITDLRRAGDSLLVATPRALSRWHWNGELLGAWRVPGDASGSFYLLAWHPLTPILLMSWIDPATGRPMTGRCSFHLAVWDLERSEVRSLGAADGWPRATVSPDGRWLVADRVSREGRGLELWDLPAGRLVERIETRRRAIRSLAFAPDGIHIGAATMRDLFVLSVTG